MQLGKELAAGFVADDAQVMADEKASVTASGADAQAPGPSPDPDPEPEPAAAG
jgi:hypothetical protein